MTADENTGAYMSFVDALPKLESLAEITPNDVDIRALYARFLNQSGRVDDALHQVEQALLVDPVNPQLHYMLGNIRSRL